MTAAAAIETDIRRLGSLPSAHANPRRRSTDPRSHSWPRSLTPRARSRDVGGRSGPGSKTLSVRRSRLCRRHLECRDRRVRTLPYEAANVMLTRYKGQLRLKDWAFAIARRSTMRKAAHRPGASPRDHPARNAAERNGVRWVERSRRRETASTSRKERRGREQTAAPILSHAAQPS
jgi:hypothetical protein